MKLKTLFLVAIAMQCALAQAETQLYDIPLRDIDGKPASLKNYQGKVLLVVNVASKCGLTPQYSALQKLQTHFERLIEEWVGAEGRFSTWKTIECWSVGRWSWHLRMIRW